MTGQELRAVLRAKGATNEDFSAHSGVSIRTITRMVALDHGAVPRLIELAARSMPSVARLKVLTPSED